MLVSDKVASKCALNKKWPTYPWGAMIEVWLNCQLHSKVSLNSYVNTLITSVSTDQITSQVPRCLNFVNVLLCTFINSIFCYWDEHVLCVINTMSPYQWRWSALPDPHCNDMLNGEWWDIASCVTAQICVIFNLFHWQHDWMLSWLYIYIHV